ncbi:MAG: CDP-alcohol phosphatidyltransferase family protein [Bacilli bacterium]|jgi:cardiolipin synthase|nr:CDP-alcohol phosphatidyltransferase family protein [Bacilli bacterium]
MSKVHLIKKKDFFTIPNILCYFRILLVPVFMYFYLTGFSYANAKGQVLEWIGLASVILASITDFIDGQIARRCHQITELGKFLDPLADKMMQFAICIVACLSFSVYSGKPYMWILTAFYAFKEITQFICVYLTFRHGQFINGAKWYGKVATFSFDILMIFQLMLPLMYPAGSTLPNEVVITISVMIYLSCIFLLVSYILYLLECFKLYKSGVNNIPPEMRERWEQKYGQKTDLKEKNDSDEKPSKGDE